MKSTNGTHSTKSDLDRLSGKEVCDIIEACKGSGVAEIKVSELHILFGIPAAMPQRIPDSNEKTTPVTAMQKHIDEDSNVQDDLNEREQDMDELILTNPEKYEELLNKGELEDITDGGKADKTA